MIPLLLCLHRTHDVRLTALAFVVCVLGVYATYAISSHAGRARSRRKRLWATISVVCTGATAWATHFILLLAFLPGVPAGFDPVLTAASLVVAIVVIGAGVVLLVSRRATVPRLLGGLAIGAGIAGLHYLGQAAYQVQAVVKWDPVLIAGSVALGLLMTSIAGLVAGSRRPALRIASAPLLLGAVGVLHFGGMGAMSLYYDPRLTLAPGLIAPALLSPLIASLAVGALVLASIGLRFELISQVRQRKTRDRLRDLANVALEGLVVCDGRSILMVNSSFERLCGSTGPALKGSDVSVLLTGVGLESMAEDQEHDAELRTHEGSLVPVRVLRRTVSAGTRVQTVLAVRDQRERLTREAEREALLGRLTSALEKAEAASLAKSQFLANMSHELRTPLNGVLGMAQALALDDLAPHQQESVQTICASGRSLLVLLNDLLDLSKIEAGHFELDTAAFDFVGAARTACAVFLQCAQDKGVALIFSAEQDVQGLWRGDQGRCAQIISNLVSNAIKFTARGSIHLEVALSHSKGLQVRVRDTGIGIEAADIPKLFEKFHQVDGANTRHYGGTGLGLAITQELAQAMGGSVAVESAPGVGSTFVVHLPLRYSGADSSTTPSREIEVPSPAPSAGPALSHEAAAQVAESRQPDHGGVRILVAEDNPTNQLVVRTLLQAFDMNPEIVGDGSQAVAAWRTGGFDLILMDIQMPDMDGIAATRRIRALEAEHDLTPTPILALTANVMDHQLLEYRAAGLNGHVAKPIQLEELGKALEHTLAACECEARSRRVA